MSNSTTADLPKNRNDPSRRYLGAHALAVVAAHNFVKHLDT
jgi:hypothetical protein